MKKFKIIQTSQANKISKNGIVKSLTFSFGNKTKAIRNIKKRFMTFQETTEKTENSIFINACISDKTDEFKRLKKVKIDTIKTQQIVK